MYRQGPAYLDLSHAGAEDLAAEAVAAHRLLAGWRSAARTIPDVRSGSGEHRSAAGPELSHVDCPPSQRGLYLATHRERR